MRMMLKLVMMTMMRNGAELDRVPQTRNRMTRPTLDETCARPIRSCNRRNVIGFVHDRTCDPSSWNEALLQFIVFMHVLSVNAFTDEVA